MNSSNWWAPLWRGLVVDATAQHYQQMSNALWLYLYLIAHANRRTGVLYRRYAGIAADMGIPPRTIRAWLAKLRLHQYIQTQRNGRGLTITVQKWKPLRGYQRPPH